MCLLALYYRMVDDAYLVVGANREEAYAREGEPPQLLDGPCRAVGGRDPEAGGTWLAVNEHGVLVAVTNRRKTQLPAAPRSRGLLVRDLLACGTAAAAADVAARELGAQRYAGCNIVCADSERLIVIHSGDWLRVRPLPPGLHVLTAHDVNDGSDARLNHALTWLSQRPARRAHDCVLALRNLCAQSGDGQPPICLHGERGGTVASSILVLREPLAHGTFLHAQGAPDRTPYQDCSYLLMEMAEPRSPVAHG